jgi:hypothetical protein
MMYTLFNISCTSFVQLHKSSEIAHVPLKPKIILRQSIYLPIEYFIGQLENNSSDINKVTIQVHMCTRPFYDFRIKTMFGSSYPLSCL